MTVAFRLSTQIFMVLSDTGNDQGIVIGIGSFPQKVEGL